MIVVAVIFSYSFSFSLPNSFISLSFCCFMVSYKKIDQFQFQFSSRWISNIDPLLYQFSSD